MRFPWDPFSRFAPSRLGLVAGVATAAIASITVFTLRSSPREDPPHSQMSSAEAARTSTWDELAKAHGWSKPRTELSERRSAAKRYLEAADYLRAFDAASEVLAQSPNDVDGLYVHAAVRAQMGQGRRAHALLDQVLTADPTYLNAFVLRGMLYLRSGQRETAIATWETGLGLAKNGHSQLEHMLDLARSGQLDVGS